MKPLTEGPPKAGSTLKRNRFWFKAFQQRYLYMMSLPFVIWIFIFSYVPVWGWLTAFQNYKPKNSIFDQKWVGFKNFIELFQDERFYIVLRNTLAMSTMGLIVGFTVPVIFALLLNEMKGQFFKVRFKRFRICLTLFHGLS